MLRAHREEDVGAFPVSSSSQVWAEEQVQRSAEGCSARSMDSQKMEPHPNAFPRPDKVCPNSMKKQPECNTGKCHLGWTTSTKPAGQSPEMPSCYVVSRGLWATQLFSSSLGEGRLS